MIFKKLFIATVMMFMTATSFAMSFAHAKVIFAKIKQANGYNVFPYLAYSDSSEINAFESGYKITIYKGMLSFVRNDNEMALILGHELAHYANGDMSSKPAIEYSADLLGAKFANKAGYNICIGSNVLLRFHDQDSSTHPNSDSRYKMLQSKYECQ